MLQYYKDWNVIFLIRNGASKAPRKMKIL